MPFVFKTPIQDKICQLTTLIYSKYVPCITSPRHSIAQQTLNKNPCVFLGYAICFGLSQNCDFFQLDNGLYLRFAPCTNDEIATQWNHGTGCSSRSVDRALTHYALISKQTTNEAISHAFENKQLLILIAILYDEPAKPSLVINASSCWLKNDHSFISINTIIHVLIQPEFSELTNLACNV